MNQAAPERANPLALHLGGSKLGTPKSSGYPVKMAIYLGYPWVPHIRTNPFLVVQSGLLPAFVSFTKLTTWCHNRHPSVSAEHEETLGLFVVFVFCFFSCSAIILCCCMYLCWSPLCYHWCWCFFLWGLWAFLRHWSLNSANFSQSNMCFKDRFFTLLGENQRERRHVKQI